MYKLFDFLILISEQYYFEPCVCLNFTSRPAKASQENDLKRRTKKVQFFRTSFSTAMGITLRYPCVWFSILPQVPATFRPFFLALLSCLLDER